MEKPIVGMYETVLMKKRNPQSHINRGTRKRITTKRSKAKNTHLKVCIGEVLSVQNLDYIDQGAVDILRTEK